MSSLTILTDEDARKIERSLLKDQIADLLRDRILKGDIAQGTKVVEREIADLLNVSRVPVRDALLQLEAEGLIVSTPNGRHVIKVTERDVKELYQIRVTLEKLAVELLIQNTTPAQRMPLLEKLDDMRRAVAQGDTRSYVMDDVGIHRLIWTLSGNSHLQHIFNKMIGPIFIFVSSHARVYDWGVTLSLHEDLISHIMAGDVRAAQRSVETHMADALQRSLNLLRQETTDQAD